MDVVKILLLTDFSSAYSRDLLKGIVRYSQKRKGWTFYRMPLYYKMLYGDNEIIKWARKWKVNAIIAQMSDIDVKSLRQLNIPIIVQNYKDRIPGICNLTGDYIGTGRMAADYFSELGYRHFAYYGINETVWSRDRFIGYRQRLEELGHQLDSQLFVSSKESWAQDLDGIGKWLMGLPDNTAVFACDDYYGLHISETCKVYDIPVPDKIAILGVDNDTMLCNISNPPLSSIVIDAQDGGFRAGQVLEELIEKNITEPFNIVVPPLQVISRGSTKKWVISDKYVLKAVEYIEHNFTSHISVTDLLELVPFSRRVFEKRFKANTGSSIYKFIQNYRISKFAELLYSTDRSIEDIAISCGFNDNRNVSRIFTSVKGMTPTEFRRRSQQKED
ncbi:MAG: substrate-binding domain-containing protein [Candidatus Cryptobacteroides sp.]